METELELEIFLISLRANLIKQWESLTGHGYISEGSLIFGHGFARSEFNAICFLTSDAISVKVLFSHVHARNEFNIIF